MAKDALIKLRCSTELKERLEALAGAREQSLSDFIRTQLIETFGSDAASLGEGKQASPIRQWKRSISQQRLVQAEAAALRSEEYPERKPKKTAK